MYVCLCLCVSSSSVAQKLTHSLIKQGIAGEKAIPSLQQVTDKFEELYQGRNGIAGLKDLETLIPAKGLLHLLERGEGVRVCFVRTVFCTHYAILVTVISRRPDIQPVNLCTSSDPRHRYDKGIPFTRRRSLKGQKSSSHGAVVLGTTHFMVFSGY